MGNKVFESLIKRKIDNFVSTYGSDSDSLFKNVYGKLIHPGEYGMYKEECLKELLRVVMNKDMSVSDGFIMTSEEDVSTQCDIIIYNSNVTSLIDSGIAKFFPVEEVNAIGEVKSDLNKTQFKEALRKLAKNKELFEKRWRVDIEGSIKQVLEFEYPLSFLVCRKLTFDLNSLSSFEIEEMYKDIDLKYWHNLILSLEDGLLNYSMKFNEQLENSQLELLEKSGINSKANFDWQYPIFSWNTNLYKPIESLIVPDSEDVYHHIISFLVQLKQGIERCYKFEFDFVSYLNLGPKDLYK